MSFDPLTSMLRFWTSARNKIVELLCAMWMRLARPRGYCCNVIFKMATICRWILNFHPDPHRRAMIVVYGWGVIMVLLAVPYLFYPFLNGVRAPPTPFWTCMCVCIGYISSYIVGSVYVFWCRPNMLWVNPLLGGPDGIEVSIHMMLQSTDRILQWTTEQAVFELVRAAEDLWTLQRLAYEQGLAGHHVLYPVAARLVIELALDDLVPIVNDGVFARLSAFCGMARDLNAAVQRIGNVTTSTGEAVSFAESQRE